MDGAHASPRYFFDRQFSLAKSLGYQLALSLTYPIHPANTNARSQKHGCGPSGNCTGCFDVQEMRLGEWHKYLTSEKTGHGSQTDFKEEKMPVDKETDLSPLRPRAPRDSSSKLRKGNEALFLSHRSTIHSFQYLYLSSRLSRPRQLCIYSPFVSPVKLLAVKSTIGLARPLRARMDD